MYLSSTLSTCTQSVRDPLLAARANNASNLITNMITRAQAAFDLAVNRPDLGWGGAGHGWGGGIEEFFNRDGSGIAAPGTPAQPPVKPGVVLGTGGRVPGTGSVSNPRVVTLPYCTPESAAAGTFRPNGECFGYPFTGIETYAPALPTLPTAPTLPTLPTLPPLGTSISTSTPSTPQTTSTPVNAPRLLTAPPIVASPKPSGDICADLRNGIIQQHEVSKAQLWECSQNARNWGVSPTYGAGDDGMNGMRGLAGCDNPYTDCAGNPRLGAGQSPAERARSGADGWMLLLGVGVIAALTGVAVRGGKRAR